MKNSREIIKAFDKELLKGMEYPAVLYKLPAYFLEMLLPLISLFGEPLKEVFVFIFLYIWGISFYVVPYVSIWEKQKQVSIYEVLKYLPVDEWDIFKVRIEYIAKLLLKRLLIMLVLQIPVIIYTGRIVRENIINSLVTVGVAAVVLILCVLPSMNKYRFGKIIP